MAIFNEAEEWAESLRMIEPGDSVIGGVGAPINQPFSTLANRTRWLKKAQEEAARGLGEGKLDKTGGTLTGALRVKEGSGINTGIKGAADHDTGWEWEQDGVLKAIVNGVERLRLSATAESGVVKISSAEGNYLLLQNDNKIAYYTAAHKLLWASDAGLTKTEAAATYLPQSGGTLSGALLAAVGTAAGKGFAFDRDSDTGMFSPRDGVLQLMANNVVVAEFDAAEALNGTSLKNKRGDRLALQVDGNGVLYDAAGKVVWSAFETVSRAELSARISELVGAAPESLRNLEALAAAMKDNADFVATILDGLAKKQDKLGYTPINKAGDTLTGVLKANGGSGNHAGIKGDIDHDTGWEWQQDGLLSGVVNGIERIRLASVSGDGTTKISSAAGNYVLLQDDGKMVYYNPAHQPIFDSSRVQTVDILTGTITDGGTIPLPPGYTQEQCFWMVSMASDNPAQKTWDIQEDAAKVHYRFECSATAARLVSAKMHWQGQGGASGSVPGTANYIIIGKKYGAI